MAQLGLLPSSDPDTGKSIPRPKLIRNLFGGSFGGPIKKDRAFFFYNYEGRRDASEESVVRFVPLESFSRGEVRFPANAVIAARQSHCRRAYVLSNTSAFHSGSGFSAIAAVIVSPTRRFASSNEL